MTVYFCNEEPIDLNAIRVLGVSVKTKDNPIGMFGTGSRFSIATLLRTGHEVELIRNGETIRFDVAKQDIRGEAFDIVTMNGEPLSFTTKLGRTWEPWQAYRELYCNCLDENGIISDELPKGEFGTVFRVSGEAVEKCHRERHTIFLSTTPIASSDDAEIHYGVTQDAFYRGVRAHKHSNVSLYTYNIKSRLDLTEDRTVKHSWYVGYYAARLIPTLTDEDILEEILLAPRTTFEAGLNFEEAGKPSKEFMATVRRLRANALLNLSAIKLWERHADIKFTVEPVELDDFEEQILARALVFLKRLGCNIERGDFLVVDGLGDSIFGTVRRNHILISKRAFDMGDTFVASTLWEEWLHRDKQMQDESRDLQNFLFEKVMSLTARLCALESSNTKMAA